jgi:hypothetical protein
MHPYIEHTIKVMGIDGEAASMVRLYAKSVVATSTTSHGDGSTEHVAVFRLIDGTDATVMVRRDGTQTWGPSGPLDSPAAVMVEVNA